MNVDSLPSTLHSMMRLLGWSTKKTLPDLSQVAPSVNLKPPESFCSVAPGAMTLWAGVEKANAASARMRREIFIMGQTGCIQIRPKSRDESKKYMIAGKCLHSLHR